MLRALLALLFVLFPLVPAEAATTQSVAYAGHVLLADAPTTVQLVGGRLYVGTIAAGYPRAGRLRIFDATDVARPVEVGRLELGDADSGVDLTVQGNLVYMTTAPFLYATGEVRVVDVSDPANPRQVGLANTSSTLPRGPVVAGGRLYTLSKWYNSFSTTLDVFDLADPTRLTRVGSLTLQTGEYGGATSMVVLGTRLYVAAARGGIQIVDVADPARPTLVGVHQPAGNGVVSRIATDGALLYATVATTRFTTAAHSLVVVDPAGPRDLGSVALGGVGGASLAVQGTTAYVSVAPGAEVPTPGGLRVFDVSDPANPRLVASADATTDAGPGSLAASAGGVVYQADGAGALWAYRAPAQSVGATELRPRAYLPVVLERAGLPLPGASDMVTSVSVRNHAAVPARVALWLLDASGSHVTTPLLYQLDARGDLLVYLPRHNLPARPYTVVVASDEAVSAQANLAGEGTASTSYAGIAATGGSTTLHAPGVYRRYAGTYSSMLTLHNPGSRAASATVTYRDVEGAVAASQGYTVPPNGTIYLTQDLGPLPDGFLGAATVTSDTPLLGVVNVGSPGGELGATALQPTPSSQIFLGLPSLYKRYTGDDWISSVLVQNVSSTPAHVSISFRPIASAEEYVLTDTIPAFGLRQYWQGAAPADLPDGFAGSARIRVEGGRVVAGANTRNDRGNFGTYAGREYASSGGELHFPSLYSGYSPDGWNSSFLLQNLSESREDVEIAYYSGGALIHQYTLALAGYETRLMYQPSPREGLPAGFRGSAVVRLRPYSSVVGIANVAATAPGAGDRLLTYEAVTVPGPR